MQLFYNPQINEATQEVVFDKQESGHIVKVLRKSEGDRLYITNGKGYLFSAEIDQANPNKCRVKIMGHEVSEPWAYHLHLAVAPTKRNERFEWFLEKATEMGIQEITPIICEHSERRKIKPDRFERVIQSAMKQSLQSYLPQLNPATAFNDFIKNVKAEQKFIAHCEEDKKQLLKDLALPQKNVLILIGPEGDFSPEEIQQALSAGYEPVSLGPTRLRTETAALAACHTLSLVNQ